MPAASCCCSSASAAKRLWPLYWSNSCCSHPRRGETMEAAIQRRLHEELGLRCPLQFLFKFQYQAQFDATGAENELCSVFIGRMHAIRSRSIPRKFIAWRWISPEALQAEMAAGGRELYPVVQAGMGPDLAGSPRSGARFAI